METPGTPKTKAAEGSHEDGLAMTGKSACDPPATHSEEEELDLAMPGFTVPFCTPGSSGPFNIPTHHTSGLSPGDTDNTLYGHSGGAEAGQNMTAQSHCTECPGTADTLVVRRDAQSTLLHKKPATTIAFVSLKSQIITPCITSAYPKTL